MSLSTAAVGAGVVCVELAARPCAGCGDHCDGWDSRAVQKADQGAGWLRSECIALHGKPELTTSEFGSTRPEVGKGVAARRWLRRARVRHLLKWLQLQTKPFVASQLSGAFIPAKLTVFVKPKLHMHFEAAQCTRLVSDSGWYCAGRSLGRAWRGSALLSMLRSPTRLGWALPRPKPTSRA